MDFLTLSFHSSQVHSQFGRDRDERIKLNQEYFVWVGIALLTIGVFSEFLCFSGLLKTRDTNLNPNLVILYVVVLAVFLLTKLHKAYYNRKAAQNNNQQTERQDSYLSKSKFVKDPLLSGGLLYITTISMVITSLVAYFPQYSVEVWYFLFRLTQ